MVGSQERWNRSRSFIDETVDYHASGGDLDALYFLTGEGSDDDRSSSARIIHDGWTRLYYATQEGWCSVIVFLLEQGADVNLGRPAMGHTPLHSASFRDRTGCDAAVLLLDAGARVDDRNQNDPETRARVFGHTTLADLLAAVRAAGGWLPYVNAPRKELLALRQRLPALRERGRAAPSSSVRAHERLFLETPDDVFTSVLAFWRSDRDD